MKKKVKNLGKEKKENIQSRKRRGSNQTTSSNSIYFMNIYAG